MYFSIPGGSGGEIMRVGMEMTICWVGWFGSETLFSFGIGGEPQKRNIEYIWRSISLMYSSGNWSGIVDDDPAWHFGRSAWAVWAGLVASDVYCITNELGRTDSCERGRWKGLGYMVAFGLRIHIEQDGRWKMWSWVIGGVDSWKEVSGAHWLLVKMEAKKERTKNLRNKEIYDSSDSVHTRLDTFRDRKKIILKKVN